MHRIRFFFEMTALQMMPASCSYMYQPPSQLPCLDIWQVRDGALTWDVGRQMWWATSYRLHTTRQIPRLVYYHAQYYDTVHVHWWILISCSRDCQHVTGHVGVDTGRNRLHHDSHNTSTCVSPLPRSLSRDGDCPIKNEGESESEINLGRENGWLCRN
jgi:hypothetical protein